MKSRHWYSVVMVVAGAGTTGFALAFRGTWSLAVPTGLLLLLTAFVVHHRRGGGAVPALVAAAILGGVLGLVGGWTGLFLRRNTPRRDVAKDAQFVDRGRLVKAELGESYEQPIIDNDGTHLRWCGEVRFRIESEEILASRCDLTPELVKELAPNKGRWLEVLYLPEEVKRVASRSFEPPRGHLDDFRYLLELEGQDQQNARGRAQRGATK